MQCSKDIAIWFGKGKVSVMSERDPNKFIEAEAKAASLECSKKEAKKQRLKKAVLQTRVKRHQQTLKT